MSGRWIRQSVLRRVTNDMLAVARSIPTVPVQRVMNLTPLADARAGLARRPGWPAIFLKAYARVSDQMPELRRAYLGVVRGRLYEFTQSIASIAVERTFDGEPGVLFGMIADPAGKSLGQVHAAVRRYAEAPVDGIKSFRDVLWLGTLPAFVRRRVIRCTMGIPKWRRKCFGTFGVTAYSALGAESLHPISPLTTTLTYGVIDPTGRVTVRIVYDHRALDGATVARALAALEGVLNGEVCRELRDLAEPRTAA